MGDILPESVNNGNFAAVVRALAAGLTYAPLFQIILVTTT